MKASHRSLFHLKSGFIIISRSLFCPFLTCIENVLTWIYGLEISHGFKGTCWSSEQMSIIRKFIFQTNVTKSRRRRRHLCQLNPWLWRRVWCLTGACKLQTLRIKSTNKKFSDKQLEAFFWDLIAMKMGAKITIVFVLFTQWFDTREQHLFGALTSSTLWFKIVRNWVSILRGYEDSSSVLTKSEFFSVK